MIFTVDPNEILALLEGVSVLIYVVSFVIALVLNVLFMMWSLKINGASNREFGAVLLTTIICALIGNALPCIGCFIAALIIQSRHDLTYGKALWAYILAGLLPFLIIVGIFVAVIGLGSITALF